MSALIYSLAPVLGVQLLALVAALFVFIHSSGRGVVRLLVVPLALVALLLAPLLFAQLMGYAVSWPLPREFTFIAYRAVVRDGVKAGFEIWLREGSTTRLQLAPYSKQMEQMLQDAAKGTKGGQEARIKRRGKGWPWEGSDGKPEGGYELRLEDLPAPPKGDAPAMPPSPEPQEPDSILKHYSI